MILLNPKNLNRKYNDERSPEIMRKLVEFFEAKGKDKLLEDYYSHEWYADFLEFVKDERIFATMCTPAGYGADDARWDTWRICEFAEILGFYGLQYWYTWQVSVLGLGPIWMSDNDNIKQQTAQALEDGGIFAFGLSEKDHGADIYSTDMILTEQADGTHKASGRKYYIGNGNKASFTSTFGKFADKGDEKGEYVFFAARSDHDNYKLIKNVVASQNYVSEYALEDYPVDDSNMLHEGEEAWNAALNTVNIGKYNLGWASIGICTHALYEAIHHAANRRLYNMYVTDFSHVKQLFVDAYCRLTAMKLFALRASDYMRSASDNDRRYLLYNPMAKMKVTTQGEDVINLMWDVIAAKGFEKDMYYSQAAVDIRALPKLEGTVHVNIALIVKFMPNFFFNPQEYPEVGTVNEARNDDFLFDQGSTRGLSKIRFHDYQQVFAKFDSPNINIFKQQVEGYRKMLMSNPPNAEQMKDIDFLLTGGELFALVVYAQLILENAPVYDISEPLLEQIFDFMVRDFSKFALALYHKPSSTEAQQQQCLDMIAKPIMDEDRYNAVWNEVHSLKDAYEMPREDTRSAS